MRMELGLSQVQTIKQIQTLSPQMYMSMEILCLNSMDLEDRIDTEVEDNVALELGAGDVDGAPAGDASDGPATAVEVPDSAEVGEAAQEIGDAAAEAEFDRRFEQWNEYSREEYGSRRGWTFDGERDGKLEALSNTEGRPLSLQEHLEQQVDLLDDDLGGIVDELSPPERAQVRELCLEIVYNIDNRGYVMYGVEEIAEALEPPAPVELVKKALAVVQSLDPPGIGGRDLKECLLLQLRPGGAADGGTLEERIVSEHLEDLGHNRLPKISKTLGATIDAIKAAAEGIARLNPRPGLLFGGQAPPFIKPDVVVEEVEGVYVVRIESDYMPRLRISSHYRQLYREGRKNPEIRRYLKKKLDSAEWLLAAIRQRQSTLQKIAEEIVSIQHGFLDHGVSHLKPLKMVEVAERVGVHVSTISRAISDKYIQTPRGIFAMKFFFTGGATRSDGTTEARESVIQRIKELIGVEDKKGPLSDIDIAHRLEESHGIKISRRTVTKYREAEGIPSSRERREY